MTADAQEMFPATRPGPVRPGRRKITSHILAGVAALFSGAVILEASLDHKETATAPAAETAISLEPASAIGMLNASFTPDGIRNRPRYPMEFDAILGPSTTKSFETFASVEWPAQGQMVLAAADPAPARKLAAVQACTGASCKPRPGSDMKLAEARRVLPPARPTLVLPPVILAEAKAEPIRVGLAEERRLQFLGVKMPGFIPSGRTIVNTMLSWGGTVADLVPRI